MLYHIKIKYYTCQMTHSEGDANYTEEGGGFDYRVEKMCYVL